MKSTSSSSFELKKQTKKKSVQRRDKWLMAIAFFIVTLLIMYVGVIPDSLNLKEGDIAQELSLIHI